MHGSQRVKESPRFSAGASQNPDWPAAQAMEVPVLAADAAAGFLASRTSSADPETAAVLAAELGYLPLALEQAAAYILATGSTLVTYLELFRDYRTRLLARWSPPGYGKSIATTWSLAFAELDRRTPYGTALLRLLACCAPEPVPLGLVLRSRPGISSELPSELARVIVPLLDDQLAANDAVAELRRFSLIAFTGANVLVHRLVQTVTKDRVPASQISSWHQAAAALIEAALPSDPMLPQTWPA